ncbi:hypothetical protein [Sphingomonas oligoaromativorans]|uniref:hypothetical protein n=1 Tax=Sphingomonas oligoaromativorans TaxID=575322 RepID=UPI00141FC096|nr:hypothetical protein [Sphingomonas oligoaromativorans]NIJ34328.1 hypothetical protein [Sphingomonas oligoaromativorans]
MTLLRLRPVGPKAARFLASTAFLCGIMGPVGSGKTITCAQKVLRIGARQKPVRNAHGVLVRHAKVVVVGATYPIIDANLLPSWFRVVPEDKGFSWDAPREHRFQRVLRKDPETGRVTEILDMIVVFRAIGDKTVEEALRGSECTAAWLYEMDTLPAAVVEYMSGRVGRYSQFDASSVIDPQIIGDFNAPDVDNYCYETFVERTMDEETEKAMRDVLGGQAVVEFFQQPPAIDKDGNVNPNAENLSNLPRGYYERQYLLNKTKKNYLDRMLRNRFVPVQHGQPVYGDEFDMDEHIAAEPLRADPTRKLIVGLDAGLTPAAVICQRDSLGKLRVLSELVVIAAPDQMIGKAGPTRFGQALRAFLAEHYPHHYQPATSGRLRRGGMGHNGGPELDDLEEERIRFICDPAGQDGTDKSGNEESWLEIVQAVIGYRLRPARSNRLHVRLEAVRIALMARGGFEMSPTCKTLRKGFLSGYHYQRTAVGDGVGKFSLEPNKNQFSHVHDALQYASMDDETVVAQILGKSARSSKSRQRGRVDLGSDYFSGAR